MAGWRIPATVTALCLSAGAAIAAAGQADPWQMGLQDPVTPVAESINSLHNFLLIIITVITLFVLGLLLYVMVKFNAKANPVPSKTTHNSLVEVLWTVIPIIILVIIAVPSFRLLYFQRNIPAADITIKAIGNASWTWTYEYPDLGVAEDGTATVNFTALMLTEEEANTKNAPYLLASSSPVVVPVNKVVKMLITAEPEGIIHAWTIPSFGMKIDAVPGRTNEDWFQATREGVYYGQCSELCGINHAFMPIEVHVVSQAIYDAWAETAKTKGIDEANKTLAALEQAQKQTAQK